MNDKWEFYKDAENKWRWRRTAPNGNIVGAVTEGYVNKTDCEGNARRNGWNDDVVFQEKGDKMKQKDLIEDMIEIKDTMNEINEENSIKKNKEFIHELVVERQLGEKFRTKHYKQVKNILYAILGILCVIVGVLLMGLLKKDLPMNLSESTLSRLNDLMVVVLDPKVDEKVIVFGDTHFDFAEASLSEIAKIELNKDVQGLKENPKVNVRMAGYTSASGTEEANQKLSEQRANAVRNYLIAQGIAPERITVVGYGRTRPAVYEVTPNDNNSKQALANMRVLFEVVVK